MDFWKTIRNAGRRSMFDTSRPVSREYVDRLLWVAQKAPVQNRDDVCHIEIIRLQETKESIAKTVQFGDSLKKASVIFIPCADMRKGTEEQSRINAASAACFLYLACTDMELVCRWMTEFSVGEIQKTLDLKKELVPVVVLGVGWGVR